MTESITDLGESLASAYRNKMHQWSALEFTFNPDNFTASFGLADDILRIEEGRQAFTALVQTLQTDFLPQDLLAISNTAALPPEQQPLISRFEKKVENYPFKLSAETSFISEPFGLLAKEEQLPAENKAADNKILPAPDNTTDFPEAKRTSSLNTKKTGNSSFENPENLIQPLAGNISAASSTKIFKTTTEDMSDLVRYQGLPGPDKLSVPEAQTPQQTLAQETPDRPNTPTDSIWTQPLRNLSDFAMRIVHPVIEKSGKDKLHGPSQVAIQDTDLKTTETNEPTGDEFAKLVESMRRPGAPNPNFEMVPLPGRPEYFPQTPDSETKQFEREANWNAPDTDDLLEALTDRILRDFHRYYP